MNASNPDIVITAADEHEFDAKLSLTLLEEAISDALDG